MPDLLLGVPLGQQLLERPALHEGLPDSLACADNEEAVHVFESETLGLGDEEQCPEAHDDHEGAEQHVRAVTKGGDHVRCRAGDQEAPEPLVGRGNGGAKHTNIYENFVSVDKRRKYSDLPMGKISEQYTQVIPCQVAQ